MFLIPRFASCINIPVKFPTRGNRSTLSIVTSDMMRMDRIQETILLSPAIFLIFIMYMGYYSVSLSLFSHRVSELVKKSRGDFMGTKCNRKIITEPKKIEGYGIFLS